MSWFRFGVKIVVFLLIAIFVDLIIGKTFDVMGNRIYAKNPKATPSDYMVKTLESDIIIIGASTALCHYIPSIIEDSLKMSTYNCGSDGTPFLVQNSLLNLLLDRYQPKVVIWEIGETSMEIEKETKHLGFLYPYYDKSKQVREMVDDIDCFQKYRMLSKTYRYNSKIIDKIKSLLSSHPSESKTDLKGYLPLDTTGYTFPSKIVKQYENSLDKKKIDLLGLTLKRCKDLNVQIVFSFSPKYLENYDEIKSSLSCQALFDIANQYEVPVLDFYTLFSDKPTLFKDNAHLNDNGAKKYMGVFTPALKKVVFKENDNGIKFE